jgi:cleavage and polyadenylation specificity factor subunit 1
MQHCSSLGCPLTQSLCVFFQFKNQDLFGVAFIDSQIYVHTLCCMKSFILVGDVMKSIDLLQFQQDYRTLAVISRDPRPVEGQAHDMFSRIFTNTNL